MSIYIYLFTWWISVVFQRFDGCFKQEGISGVREQVAAIVK